MEYLLTGPGERSFKSFLKKQNKASYSVENPVLLPSFAAVWQEAHRRERVRRPLKRLLPIAASVLLAAGLLWLGTRYREPMVESLGLVTYQHVTTSAGENANVTLPDGSTVKLNEQSTLSYPEYFFGKRRRPVKLIGEAYFEVTSDASKPFTVETEVGTVEVVGTAFNLLTNPIDSFLSLAVTEGKVALQLAGQPITGQPPMVQAGELGTFRRGQLEIKTDPALGNYLSWFNRRLVFEDMPLRSITEQLEDMYDVSITIPQPMADTVLSFQVRRAPVADVLDEIALTLNLILTQQQDQYKLMLR